MATNNYARSPLSDNIIIRKFKNSFIICQLDFQFNKINAMEISIDDFLAIRSIFNKIFEEDKTDDLIQIQENKACQIKKSQHQK